MRCLEGVIAISTEAALMRRTGLDVSAEGSGLTPPGSAWRRCHPPLRGGKRPRYSARSHVRRGAPNRHVHAYLLIPLILVLTACATDSAQPEPSTPPTLVTTTAQPAQSTAVESSLCSRVDGPACVFDYANFDDPTVIDNEWLPMTPGMQFVFDGTTNEENELLEHRVIITVTDLTKVIDGVESVVSWDLDFSEGELVEAELAFFAQDNDGNVWRMGEHPEEYEDGAFVEAPTWLAGVEGAKAGISMLADPVVGSLSYSQGWAPVVEFIDRGRVHATGEETCVEFDCYSDVVVVGEFNVEEQGALQLKYFAPGVGNVQVDWSGVDETQEELELVSAELLDAAALADVRMSALELEASAYEVSPTVYGTTQPAVGPE